MVRSIFGGPPSAGPAASQPAVTRSANRVIGILHHGRGNEGSYLLPLGSRFSLISSSVTFDSTPPLGTSALQIQTAALRTTLRKLSSSQFLWKCPPVKPTPRPPSGRSVAHIIVSVRPLAS